MKIGLVNPNKELKHPAVHIGLGYLASYAKQKHSELNFELIDTRVAKSKEIKKFLETSFDFIGITASSQVFLEAVDIAQQIKNKYPDTPICLGGSHISTVKEEALIDFPFDYGVYGEGEITFSELIDHLNGNKELKDIDGIIYKNQERNVIVNPPRQLISEIDEIPFPLYDLFKMNRYPQHRLTTSRGCPFNCVFCNSHSLWTNKWRKRSPQNILSEIKLLVKDHKRKSIVFNDDSFNIDAKRIIELCNLIIEEKLDIIWSTSIRVDLITDKIAHKMKESGCYNVSIGIESANNEVLKKMNKKSTKEKIYNGIQILRRASIDVMGQFMIGNPGDTLESVKESIEFAKTSNLTGAEFYTALPYKDSLLFEFVQSSGKMLTDEECYTFHNVNPRIVFETPDFTYEQRLKAIDLAIENGFYNALSKDEKSFVLDFGRNLAKLLQKLFKGKIGNFIYLKLRNAYKIGRNLF
ncbi:B12-binding domain-containing radical SAM protein [Bacteroidota bacterium]